MTRRIVVDFEFKIDDTGRNPPRIRCMAALEVGSGQTWTMWEDELYATPVCPFPIGPDVQIICFQAKAEGRCFAALDWEPPARVIDLFVERLRLLNPAHIGKAINFCLMYGGGVPGLAAKLRCPSHEAATFLASVLKAFPVFTQWSDYQVAAAQCRGWMESPRGWRLDATKVTNPRTLRNWQMQTGGSEMLQAAIVLLMVTHSVRICATMHDAIMVELPLESWRADLDRVRAVMEAVGEIVTGGLKIRTDERVMMPGERYVSEADGEWGQWQRIWRAMGHERAA